MNVGEDDLFLQRIMTPHNTSVVLSPRATLRERIWGRYGLVDRPGALLRRHEALLPSRAISYLNWEMGSRVIFFLAVLCALIFLPVEFKVAAGLLLLLRYALVAFEVRRLGQRLGETDLWRRYFLYDLWSPLQALWIKLLLQRKDPRVWR